MLWSLIFQESFSNSTKTCSQSKFHICTAQVFSHSIMICFIYWPHSMVMMVINAKTCSHVQHRGSHFCKYLQGGGAKWKSSRKKVAACAKNLLQKLFEFAPFINCMIWKCSVLKANYGYLSVNWENRSLKMGVRSHYSSNVEEEENISIQIIRLSDHMSDYQIICQIIRSDFYRIIPFFKHFQILTFMYFRCGPQRKMRKCITQFTFE